MKSVIGYLLFSLGMILLFGSIVLVDTEVLGETVAILTAVLGIVITVVSFYFNLKSGDD